MQKSSIWPQVFAAASASLIFICTGFHQEWIRLSLPKMMNEEFHVPLTMHQASWIGALLPFGSICGPLLGLILAANFGRRTALLFMTVPLVVSCALIAGAQSFWYFYVARFIAGVGIGAAFMLAPMYIGEISEDRIRGGLCALMSVMVIIGQLTVGAIGPSVSVAALAIVGAVIPVVFFTALLWAPETPYFYAIKNAPNDTRKSLAWLKGTSDVVREVDLIHNSIALNNRRGVNFMNLFTVTSNRKALCITIGLLIGQQLSSTSLLSSFGPDPVHRTLKINPDLLSIILLAIRLLVSIFVVFLTDKVGRRPLLLISASLCAACLFAAGVFMHLHPAGMDFSSIIALETGLALIGCSISASIGLGALPSVVAAEIFPCEVKALALAISTVCYFAAGIGLSFLWVFALSFGIGLHLTIYLLAACNIASAIFIYFAVPETKGRSLSEIQIALRGHFQTRL